MANARYNCTFSDNLGSVWLIEIWRKSAYVGTTDPIKLSGNPLNFTVRGNGDMFCPIMITEANLEIVSEQDLEFYVFFTANRGAWTLKVYKDSLLYWQGQNVTEVYQEPYTVTPYFSTMKFSDFGDLDFIYYKDGSNFFSGRRSLAQIILDCTNKLENTGDLFDLTNVSTNQAYLDSSITDKSGLVNTYLDARAFIDYKNEEEEPMTCMEVLRRILTALGSRIIQVAGNFFVIRIDQYAQATGYIPYWYSIDKTTALVINAFTSYLIARDIDNDHVNGITPINQDQILSMSERYNKVDFKYITQEILRKQDEMIFNSDWTKGVQTSNGTNSFPKHWAISSDITSSNACKVTTNIQNQNKKMLSMDYSMPGFLLAQTIPTLGNKYLHATSSMQDANLNDVQVTTDDNLRIKIRGRLTKQVDYGYMAAHNPPILPSTISTARFYFIVRIKVTYNSGIIRYFYRIGSNNPQPQWKNVDTYAVYELQTPSYSSNQSGVYEHTDPFEIEFDTPKFQYDDLADFDVRFYIPTGMKSTATPYRLFACHVDEFSIRYISDGDWSDELSHSISTFTLTDAKENIYNITTYLGDGPTNYCLSSFRTHNYTGVTGYTDGSYIPTSDWRALDVSTLYNARDIFCIEPAGKFLSAYQRRITGSYFGEFESYYALNIDDGSVVIRYLILSDSYDVKSCIHNVEMVGIDAQSVTITTVGSYPKIVNSPLRLAQGTNQGNTAAIPFTSSSNAVVSNGSTQMNLQNSFKKYPG